MKKIDQAEKIIRALHTLKPSLVWEHTPINGRGPLRITAGTSWVTLQDVSTRGCHIRLRGSEALEFLDTWLGMLTDAQGPVFTDIPLTPGLVARYEVGKQTDGIWFRFHNNRWLEFEDQRIYDILNDLREWFLLVQGKLTLTGDYNGATFRANRLTIHQTEESNLSLKLDNPHNLRLQILKILAGEECHMYPVFHAEEYPVRVVATPGDHHAITIPARTLSLSHTALAHIAATLTYNRDETPMETP